MPIFSLLYILYPSLKCSQIHPLFFMPTTNTSDIAFYLVYLQTEDLTLNSNPLKSMIFSILKSSKELSGTFNNDEKRLLKMAHKVFHCVGPNSHNKLLHFLVLEHGPAYHRTLPYVPLPEGFYLLSLPNVNLILYVSYEQAAIVLWTFMPYTF